MGNWRNRPPRRQFNHSTTYPQYDSEIPNEFLQDNVPPWEKKFCYEVGSVPWRKVVNAKYLMSCHGNVLNWDDSAVEETFRNAKKRFWAEMNGLPCDISLPDPDIYIDEVDWNLETDAELVKDLDREFFAPADEESDVRNKLLRKFKRLRRWSFGTDPNSWVDTNKNDDTQVNNGVPESKEWNDHVKGSKSVNDNNETVEKADWSRDDINSNPWERGNQGFVSTKDSGWGGACDTGWGWNRKEWNNDNSANLNHNSWARSSSQQQWSSSRDHGRGGGAWRGGGGGRQWGRNNNDRNRDSRYRQGGFGYRDSRFRVEEEYRASRFRVEEEYPGNNKKRGWFE